MPISLSVGRDSDMCLSYEETDGRNEDVDERDGGIRQCSCTRGYRFQLFLPFRLLLVHKISFIKVFGVHAV